MIGDESKLEESGEVRTAALAGAPPPPALSTVLASHTFEQDELRAIAEIGYTFHRAGRVRLARAVFEGLAALAPELAYAHLGAGLMNDYLGDADAACRHYERARAKNPRDPRPDLNQAELLIQSGKKREAQPLIRRGWEKARRIGDRLLEQKARAMMQLLDAVSGGSR